MPGEDHLEKMASGAGVAQQKNIWSFGAPFLETDFGYEKIFKCWTKATVRFHDPARVMWVSQNLSDISFQGWNVQFQPKGKKVR